MRVLRVRIRSWTASFRYPIFVSGLQPTLPLPPLSTIYGLISAVKGEVVTPVDTSVGYVFFHKAKAIDLETIYELEGMTAKSNVARREFLYDNELYLYITNLEFETSFHNPHYPVLLGRSTELAMIDEITTVDLGEEKNKQIGRTILPFPMKGAYGPLQSLPTFFSDEVNRKAHGTKPFYLVDEMIVLKDTPVLFDNEKQWGVYIHLT